MFDGVLSSLENVNEREANSDINPKDLDDVANGSSDGTHRKSIQIRRVPQPITELSHNDDLLYGGFWTLFPLQKGLPTTGSLNPKILGT